MSSTTRSPRPRRAARAEQPTHQLASMPARVTGAAIDMALLVVAAGLMSSLIGQRFDGVVQMRVGVDGSSTLVEPLTVPLWLPLVCLITLSALYTIPQMALWGRTVGGWCVGIRAVRLDDGRPLGWAMSSRRWLLLYGIAGMLSLLPIIGGLAWLLTLVVGLSPLWDTTRHLRGYADHWAGDAVVRAPWGR